MIIRKLARLFGLEKYFKSGSLEYARQLYLSSLANRHISYELEFYFSPKVIRQMRNILENNLVYIPKGDLCASTLKRIDSVEHDVSNTSVYKHIIVFRQVKLGGLMFDIDRDIEQRWLVRDGIVYKIERFKR